jgi:hypothetical protein
LPASVTAYKQGPQSKTDTGEYWVSKKGEMGEFNGLTDTQIQSAYDQLSGDSSPFVVEQKAEAQRDKASLGVDSPAALVKLVEARQAAGKLPITLVVNDTKLPFNQKYPVGYVPGLDHYVDLTGVVYRDGVPYIQVANSWGSKYDNAYPASELFQSDLREK